MKKVLLKKLGSTSRLFIITSFVIAVIVLMIIPSYAGGNNNNGWPDDPTFDADELYILGTDFFYTEASTNKQTVAHAFWFDSEGNLYVAVAMQHNNEIDPDKNSGTPLIINTDPDGPGSYTYPVSYKEYEPIDKNNPEETWAQGTLTVYSNNHGTHVARTFEVSSQHKSRWIIINFGQVELTPQFNLTVITDLGGGHHLGGIGTVRIVLTPALAFTKEVASITDSGETPYTDSYYHAAGDIITYTYKVENTGTATLTSITVIEQNDWFSGTGTLPAPAFVDSSGNSQEGQLVVGETASYTATYIVTQEDVDNGEIRNEAKVTATYDNIILEATGSATVQADQKPGVSIVKEANPITVLQAGKEILYTFTVTNTGNVTLTGITVEDDQLGTITMNATELVPGDSTSGTADYTVTQADIDAQEVIVNIATVETDQGITDEDSARVTIAAAASVEIKKTANPTVVSEAGTMVAYTYVVTNTGAKTLTGIAVEDDQLGTITMNATELAPGDSTSGTADYIVTQTDIDAGDPIVNTATVTTNQEVTDNADATVTIAREPSIMVTKMADKTTYEVGDEITYTFTVTNNGIVTLTDVTAYDDFLDKYVDLYRNDVPVNALAPGEFATGTLTYTVLENDLDSGALEGKITNVVTASGYYGEEELTDVAEVTVDIFKKESPPRPPTRNPAISVTKEADRSTYMVGDTITYTYKVTNTGRVNLTGVTAHDDQLGKVMLSKLGLAPGDSANGTLTYQVKEDDLNAGALEGSITNTVDAKGFRGSTRVEDKDRLTVQVKGEAAISVAKLADKSSYKVDDTVTYTYRVTNTGNVTLVNVAALDDQLGAVNLDKTMLAPGHTTTGKLTYRVVQGDLNAGALTGSITNIVETEGYRGNTRVEDEARLTVNVNGVAAISVIKEADGDNYMVGDTITYTYQLTNTGSVNLTGVEADDDQLGAITLNKTLLAPGETTTGTLTYTVIDGDLDQGNLEGSITNIVDAAGFRGNIRVIDDAELTVDIYKNPPPAETPEEETIISPEPPRVTPPTMGNSWPVLSLGFLLLGSGALLKIFRWIK